MKTLIVEDDITCCALLQKILEIYGECHFTFDGREGLDTFFKAHDENNKYDLICLDIMMPVMDGHEVLREVRTWEKNKGINKNDRVKIIMTTALDDGVNISQSFEEQCDAYITKPIGKKKLLDEVLALGLI